MATSRQKKATKLVLEGKAVSRAMAESGYSKNTAKNPQVLTRSDYFLQTMEKLGITDDKLAKTINEGLEAKESALVKGEGLIESDIPDHNVRHKFLETSLKLKGLSKEHTPSVVVVPIYGGPERIKL